MTKRTLLRAEVCHARSQRRILRLFVAVGAVVSITASAVSSSEGSSAQQGRDYRVAAGAAIATGPLETAIVDGSFGPSLPTAFARVKSAGATKVRLVAYWRDIAPAERPGTFVATNPGDPAYRWSALDEVVTAAVAAGLEPMLCVLLAPHWAERGTTGAPGTRDPDPVEFGRFAAAIATRYNGTFGSPALPRVKFWQAWNEPNLDLFMMPQFVGDEAVSPRLYRDLLNEFAAAVHSVHANNVVIAGSTSPYGEPGRAVAPLRFMRELFSQPSTFDVWAHQPYTFGGPTREAVAPDDVSIGDLPEMRQVLEAGIDGGSVISAQPVRFWVTEFSWDSYPPDPRAIPPSLHARWVSEALYRMWTAGVSLVTWFQLRDDPFPASQFQSGLYRYSAPLAVYGRPKPALRAFRFPFVALPIETGVFVWGRIPGSVVGSVRIEHRSGLRPWQLTTTVPSNAHGIFAANLPPQNATSFRAVLADNSDVSESFTLASPPEILRWPFGCGGELSCDFEPTPR